MEAEISMGEAMARVLKLSKLNKQGKLKFGLKWRKYQVVDEMVKVAIFAYERKSIRKPRLNLRNVRILGLTGQDRTEMSHFLSSHSGIEGNVGDPITLSKKSHWYRAVPSSLHQKLKLVTDGRLITINAEEDIIATVTSEAPYVESNEESIECSFCSPEIINATFILEGSEMPIPKMSGATRMALQMMMGRGALPGKGLGRQLQGGIQIPKLIEKKDRFGLGFKPDHKHKRQEIEKRQARRKARLNGREVEWEPMTFPPISKSFKSGGLRVEESRQINVVNDRELKQRSLEGIRPYEPGSSLNNWTAEDLLVVFRSFSESLDINDMSTNIAVPDFSCEQGMCLEEPQDFEDVQDYDVSLDLLRMDMPRLSTDIVVHHLPIRQDCKPVQQKLRRMRPDIVLKIKDEVKKQFDARFLQEVKYSEWVANIVPIPKKDGKVRMCVDYRDLNKASPKDNFPLPHIDTLVDNTAGYSLFSLMDGFSGYNQIKMHPEDMDKTTFITLWGTFCYKVMPFGLKNARATYQRAMVNLFHDMMHKDIEVYVDDMIAKSRTEKEHIEVLRRLFLRLRKFQLKLNPAKCTFRARSGKLLGFVVSEKGIGVDSDKVRAIRELPPPRTQKEVRGFLGRLNYIAQFISQFTEKCDPIFHLLRKHNQGTWDEECQNAFEKVKQYLLNAPVLSPPSADKPLILYLSVFSNSMGCVLGQHDESGKKEKAIYYLSKKLTDCEMRYSPIEKLCCALIWTTRRLRQYMLYHTTWLISKLDPLKYMMESTALNGRMARWQILLSEFDIVYVSQKAIKGSMVADFLASRALEDYEPLNFDFPNEELMCIVMTEDSPWKLNFDGASNAVGNGIGAVLVSPNGDHYPFTCKLDFDCTNNMAKYEACIMGLQAAIERGIKTLEVYGDSALVIYQLRGEWETRDPKLINYRKVVLGLLEEFDDITFNYLPRDKNQIADALATLASMIKANKEEEIRPIQMSVYEAPASCCNLEEEEKDDNPWYQDILRYVRDRKYPEQATKNDKRTLRRLACDYVLDGDVLYKRRKYQVLLRCVNSIEAKLILEEATLEGDCINYAKKCHKCQIYGDKIHVPPSPLHVMTFPWPFSMWGMDVIGPISLKASNGHRFIFVKEIICQYGMPEKIISDNALNLNNKTIAEVCDQFKIKHHNSSPYRPKMNGAVEAANKNIKKINLYWATPFSLVYGMEAVLPIEVEIPSLRILTEIRLDEAEWVQSRYDQLNFIEEKRLRAIRHGKMYQKRMMRAYDKKVRLREFHEGDLVLKKILPIQKDFRGKWMPNWEGLYVVKKAFSGGALILTEMDGKSLPSPVNSDSVKKYFV
ncbi:hypothetical protein CXB51_002957 [Gossypium anomalum]|uniref:Uncharacterized protein n=1 Tax=Gossypium anomalum TaxID=47600 RepID=A0A8J5ZZW5_9ROSI|nr:hypothetical protein CXB51_002957 [Gossypium anomalum]